MHSLREGTPVPAIDAVMSRSANGRQIFIKIVNTDPSQPIPAEILLTGVHIAKQTRIETLNGSDLKASNDFTHPDLVHITADTISAGSSFTLCDNFRSLAH